jgi:hypothetical protein
MMPARFHLVDWQAGAAAGLRLTGWLAVNVLTAMGLVALVAVAIGNFTFAGTMAQLANLSGRYVAADAARQGQFNLILASAAVLAFVATSYFRRHAALSAAKRKRS